MTLTRKQSREALGNVLTNVLELKSEPPIQKTAIHNHCDCIADLVNIADMDIPNLHCKSSTNELESIFIGHQNLIRIFVYYFQYRIHDNDHIGYDWVNITNDDFNEVHIAGYDAFRRFRMAGIVNTRPTSTTFSSNPYYPVENFKRSIKHDPTLFPAFKDQALWENWNHNAIATTYTQDVEDIFHEAYITSTPDDMALFKGEKYMYSVFVKMILPDQGKKIAREHQGDK